MSAESRLSELGIDLPPAARPVASYVPVALAGDLAFVAGQVPLEDGKPMVTGRLGDDLDTQEGISWARRCGLQCLAALRGELGSLDRVTRIAQVSVFVASADTYTEQPTVANGASDLFVEVFGDGGRHARAAVGVPVLPLGAPVEVALIASVA
ncbi:MAG: RidA family protein [Actinomycetota bacterium]|nr:RidA family protein [Actinomycetota bacterium]